ncbi:uncharacterized protein METZ01_LOCUS18863 [marine metagenome]|uniref:Uncharacterized protein n=1 Tax=marine metagenome TaxID=408172 RepID=A0A381PIS7_9ZZZZ
MNPFDAKALAAHHPLSNGRRSGSNAETAATIGPTATHQTVAPATTPAPTTAPTETPISTPTIAPIRRLWVDSVARTATERKQLIERDQNGRVWEFVTEGPIGIDPVICWCTGITLKA